MSPKHVLPWAPGQSRARRAPAPASACPVPAALCSPRRPRAPTAPAWRTSSKGGPSFGQQSCLARQRAFISVSRTHRHISRNFWLGRNGLLTPKEPSEGPASGPWDWDCEGAGAAAGRWVADGSGVKGETDPAVNSDSATYFLYDPGLSFPNWTMGLIILTVPNSATGKGQETNSKYSR